MTIKWCIWLMILPLHFLCFWVYGEEKTGSNEVIEAIQLALETQDYAKVYSLVDQRLKDSSLDKTNLLYLKSLAYFYQKNYKEAEETLRTLIAIVDNNPWLSKGRFLLAKTLIQTKNFHGAEVIYSQEARRLHSPARKEEIAKVVVQFAELLSKKPAPEELTAPQPDYNKAYILYEKALDLHPGEELSEDISYRLGMMRYLNKDWYSASEEFKKYLDKYDIAANKEKPGKHFLDARYFWGESTLLTGGLPRAREIFEDLITYLRKNKVREDLVSDSMWQLSRTYGIPSPSNDADLGSGVEALRRYLNLFPEGKRSVEASYDIARSYIYRGQTDEAISSVLQFVDGKGYKPGKDGAETLDTLSKEALYQLGELYSNQRRYEEAIKTWNRYISLYPNGPHWSKAQEGILQAEYQIGELFLEQKKIDEAKDAWNMFMKKYPLDSRIYRILFIFGEIEYQDAAKKKSKQGFEKAIEEWEKLVSKYPNTNEAQIACFRIGKIYEEELGELKKALETYRKIQGGDWYYKAQERITTMTHKHLSLLTEKVYRTNEEPKVKVNLRNIKAVTVKTYKLNLEEYFRKVHSIKGIENLDLSLIEPDKKWEVKIDEYAEYLPVVKEINIPIKDAGVYAVTIGEEDLEATTLVIRSDLDLIMKTSKKEVLVFVENVRLGKPAEGVNLLISDGSRVIGEGKTNQDGVWLKKLDSLENADKVSVFGSKDDSIASSLLSLSGLKMSIGLSPKGYIYTDRPAYRPGELINIRGILRDVVDGSYAVPNKDIPYIVTVYDPRGKLLIQKEISLSSFGTLHTDFNLAEQASLGEYRVDLFRKEGKQRFSGTFKVAHLELAKVRLSLTFSNRVYFRGEKIEATFQAAYYYGEPLTGKPVHYTLPDGRSFVENTDSDGKLKVEFDTIKSTPGTMLTFRGRLDAEGVEVEERVALASYGFNITLGLSKPLILAGESVEVTVRTQDPTEKPVSTKLMVTAYQRVTREPDPILSALPWKGQQTSTWAEIKVGEKEVTTDETGLTRVSFTLEQGGDTIIRAVGKDRFENPVSAEKSLFVSGQKDTTKLHIFATTNNLKVGESVTVQLHSRLEQGLGLVTFEGEGILGYRVLSLNKDKNALSFTVDHTYFPNFVLGVAAMRDNAFYQANEAFTVERELKLMLNFDKNEYIPGKDAKVEVVATDHLGNPVEAEISLSLLDQALLALHPDKREPIVSFFQKGSQRVAEMRTISSSPFVYEAKTIKVEKEVRREQDRLSTGEESTGAGQQFGQVQYQYAQSPRRQRRTSINAPPQQMIQRAGENDDLNNNLNEPAEPQSIESSVEMAPGGEKGEGKVSPRQEIISAGWWTPAVVTDKKGKATVTIPMPDKITSWTLVAIGATVETLVGESSNTTLTRKDFFLSLKAPSMLREGDKPRFLARVHNLAGIKGNLTLTLEVNIEESRPVILKKKIELKDKGTIEVTFDSIEIPAGLEAKVDLNATLEGGKVLDALTQTIPIEPWGLEYSSHRGGQASGDTTLFLTLPPHNNYKSNWMTVVLAPDIQQTVVELAMGVSYRGYRSSIENDLLACATVLKYAGQVKTDPGVYKGIAEKTRSLVAATVASQREDGGWAWIGNPGKSDLPTTSYTLWALSEAKEAGITVDDDTINKAVRFLNSEFTGIEHTDDGTKAMVQHSLARVGQSDFAYGNRLYRQRNVMGPAGLAYTALLLDALKRKEMAAELLALLSSTKNQKEGKSFWPASQKDPWFSNPVETTALVVLAFESVRPESKEVKEGIAYLLDQRRYNGFIPDRSKGPAVAALARYFLKEQYAQNDYTLAITVNDNPLKTLTVKGASPTMLLDVPKSFIKPRENRVKFKLDGHGSYTYAVTLRGFSSNIKDPVSWTSPRITGRDYVHAPLDYKGLSIGYDSTSPVSNVEMGQIINVRIHFHNNGSNRYFVLEEPIPSGTIVVKDSLQGNFSNHEIDRGIIRFYFDKDRYVSEVRYNLAAYVPGSYRSLPTVLRLVHDPSQMRIGNTNNLTVLAPGETSKDVYVMNIGEHYKLGELLFNDKEYKKALYHLTEVNKNSPLYNQKEVVRMLLWILCEEQYYEAGRIVDLFEILKEKYPELYIPFDKILVIGKAYEDMREYERAQLVYSATIEASFEEDAKVAGVLEDQGEFLGAIDYMKRLWSEYHDSPGVIQNFFSLSQTLYDKANNREHLAQNIRLKGNTLQRKKKQPSKVEILNETINLLKDFLSLYPEAPQNDDAGFSLTNAYLALDHYKKVVELAKRYQTLYPKSEYLSSFKYMEALGYFSQHAYNEAIGRAKDVAEGDSKDKDYATYILGQIYHASGDVEDAIKYYRRIDEKFPDAKESIEYFEKKKISLPEVTKFKPGEKVEVKISYRNIKKAFLQIYRVDLMQLYLKEKNLRGITKVQLTGITPVVEKDIVLGKGTDYQDKEKPVELEIKEDGAYLVICRGDDLFTSGLILLSPLKIEAQEDTQSGRVRVYIYDEVKNTRPEKVHVKVIGTASTQFISGESDLRGIFIADAVHGNATVIARDKKNCYAFYRGENWLGPKLEDSGRVSTPSQVAPMEKTYDFRKNLEEMNKSIQSNSMNEFKGQIRRQYKGVQVEQTK